MKNRLLVPSSADQDPPEDAGRRDDRADRQVDACRCDHEGHADCEHADDARLGQHVADVVHRRERVGLQDRADDEQQHDDDGERVLLQLERLHPAGERGAPAGLGRLSGRGHTTSSARTGASVGATAWRRSSRSVASLALDLRHDLALAHDEDARADVHELLELRRDDEHAEARLRQVADDPVDLGLRRDVDAARRLVQQEHAALVQQPACEHDLLLVAARQEPDDRGRGRRARCSAP